ncbi:ATP-dependent RNA helicase HrpA [Desulfosarcina sp. OttesenSCG-928-A07]|nr:ATP-dependent RNA helicase HrpA [Desulfosarcina sp. OttesenSCG-928-G17]MDL2329442.1 ATP-dependent RNA helicase HrpA [Desulfosarcina sp. OttesenSCG-928-A07]
MSNRPLSTDLIRKQLTRACHLDRVMLGRRLDRLSRNRKKWPEDRFFKELAELAVQVQTATAKRRKRISLRPKFSDLTHLPITAAKTAIIDAIRKHPVTIISGETGSGKTTQIPKFCLEAGRGIDGQIVCTQPRRIAATTVAARIAEELGETPGHSVGYKIRFQDHTSPDAYIKVVTDGILLAETQGDPWLNAYDTIIVDEAHERSLNIDFVLGILKHLVQRRRGLKLIITSATIDTEKFSQAFDNAPIIEVSGRLFPVETRYLSPETESDGEEKEERTPVELAVRAVDDLVREGPGDMLVFMPTEQDIRETCEILGGRGYPKTWVLPLFARLGQGEQSRVFTPTGLRKIIVATNVAETSITIPGIRYVVDTGLARISQYVPRSGTTRLPVVPVSRSSADQRKGRCGRVQNGICVRLYTEENYLNRPLFTLPEILRANLADVILRMIALKLGDVADFPFIDRPAEKSIRDGFNLLTELGAIHRGSGQSAGAMAWQLTEHGRIMARMPIDPRLSRMLIQAREENCLAEMMVIAAALSIQDVRERPLDQEAKADQAHRRFVDPLSDFVTTLNIWQALHTGPDAPRSMGALKKFCKQHYLSFRRIREWRDIHTQICAILREQGIVPADGKKDPKVSENRISDKTADAGFHPLYAAIHRSILTGFLSNIAMQKEKMFYRATRDRDVMLFPGSGLFQHPGAWIVAAEMVETSRLYARQAAVIDVAWLEPLAGDLCRHTFSDPHWSRSRGEVVAREQVSLFGLPIVQNRQRAYARIDPDAANEIFIRAALIEMDVKQPLAFMRHNAALMDEIQNMEDRIRRRDIRVDDEVRVAFYKERLPGITTMRALKHVIRKKGGDDFLRLTVDAVTCYLPKPELLAQFPQNLDLGHRVLPFDYVFDPGTEADGVTVTLPAESTGDVPKEQLDWLVPGLLPEKMTALIRGLPKAYRVQLVPVAETVDLLVREMPQGKESLTTAMSRFLFEHRGIHIPADAWPVNDLPDHLRIRLSITDAKGNIVASGRDAALLDHQAEATGLPPGFRALRSKWERSGLVEWNFGDLPKALEVKDRKKRLWRLFPRLTPNGDAVDIQLYTDEKTADAAHFRGVATLFSRRFADDIRHLKKNLKLPPLLKRQVAYFGGLAAVEAQLGERVIQTHFFLNILSAAEFEAQAAVFEKDPIHRQGQDLREAAIALIEARHGVLHKLTEIAQRHMAAPVIRDFVEARKQDLLRLVPETAIQLYNLDRLQSMIRYLRAAGLRIERGLLDFEKDRARQALLDPYLAHFNKMLESLDSQTSAEKRAAVEDFFWMIEEYRISLFAQEVGTNGPISAKRLDRQAAEIFRMS